MLFIAAALFGIGVFFILGIVFPLGLYTVPYLAWIDDQKKQYSFPKKLESESYPVIKKVFHDARNATKLYRSWLTKKPHGITRF